MMGTLLRNNKFRSLLIKFILGYSLVSLLLLGFFLWGWKAFQQNLLLRDMVIIGQVSDLNDAGKEEVLATVLKYPNPDSKAVKKGIAVAKRYGYTQDMKIDETRHYRTFQKFILGFGIILAVGFFILLIFLWGFGQSFFKHLRRLIQGADQMMDGDFDLRLHAEGEGELALLGFQFNQMAHRLQLNLNDLHLEKEHLQSLISNISHQLKTPLAVLRTYNDLLLEGAGVDQVIRQEFLETSSLQLDRMEWLVKNLLKLSRLEAGVIQLNPQKLDLVITCQEVIQLLKPTWQKKKISFQLFGMESERILIHDREWLQEALENILKNGIEYSPIGGKMMIKLKKTESLYKIMIKDWGNGIHKEDLPHIFSKFYQGQNSHEGSGIGLALAKLVIEKHHGFIHVESQLGRGTNFTVALPIG